jgi:hypothetical protein
MLAGMLPAEGVDHEDIEVDVQDSHGYEEQDFGRQNFNQLMRNRKGDDRSGKKAYQEQEEDDEAELQGFGYNQNGDEDEVSLDIQDAIAEELGSSQRKKRHYAEEHDQHNLDDEINREIAEIVAEDQDEDDHQDEEIAIQDNEEDGIEEISPHLMAVAQQMGLELDPE